MEKIKQPYQIRRAKFEDAPKIFKLGDDAFDGYGMENWSFQMVAEMLEEYPEYNLVAVKDKRILGFLLGKPYEESPHRFYVNWVSVNPSTRGMGIGSALMDKISDIAKRHGFKSVIIDTQRDNHKMQHILRKTGFSPIEEEIYFVKKLTNNATNLNNETQIIAEID
jgi:ribosomal protein S18 acetylase RimI-like enzyme